MNTNGYTKSAHSFWKAFLNGHLETSRSSLLCAPGWPFKFMKYFLYARKSTDVEDKQVMSIEAQLAELRALAKSNSLEIVEEFVEKKTAKMPGRSVFNDMVKRIQKGEVQGIICWKLDRLARNPVDGGQISWML